MKRPLQDLTCRSSHHDAHDLVARRGWGCLLASASPARHGSRRAPANWRRPPRHRSSRKRATSSAAGQAFNDGRQAGRQPASRHRGKSRAKNFSKRLAATSRPSWNARHGRRVVRADGRIETINSAALRLLDVDGRVVGSRADALFLRDDLHLLEPLMRRAQSGASPAAAQEFALVARPRAAGGGGDAAFRGTSFGRCGIVRRRDAAHQTQRAAAWRDGAPAGHGSEPADRSAVLSGRAAFRRGAGAGARAGRGCTTTIAGEVESLGARDEFAHSRARPGRAGGLPGRGRHAALYNGLFRDIRLERRSPRSCAARSTSAGPAGDQLVDNAVEAPAARHRRPERRRADHRIETRHDRVNGVARIRRRQRPGILPRTATSRSCPTIRPGAAGRPARHRPPHHRGARRQHRGRGQRAGGNGVHDRLAALSCQLPASSYQLIA